MKKIIIIFLVILLLALLGIYFFSSKEQKEIVLSLELIDQGETIRVLEEGEIVFNYSIEEFRQWAKNNWAEIFIDAPAFGQLRAVEPDYFYRFDEGASLSPDYRFLAFSVNDYAAASTLSFIVIVDLSLGKIEMIGEENKGGVREIIWSPTSSHIAYILDTARAKGDYFSVDNAETLTKKFTFTGADVLLPFPVGTEIDDQSDLQFMPKFDNLDWSADGQRLSFVSAYPDMFGIEDDFMKWGINIFEEYSSRKSDF